MDDTARVFVHDTFITNPVVSDFNFSHIHSWVTSDERTSKGGLFWFSMNGSIKIISGTEVFTFYEDGNDFHHILNTRRYFSKYFNIPEIIGTDTDNKRIIEKYIPFNPDNFPSIKQIFNQYLHYFKNVSEENIRYFSLHDLMKKSRNLSNQSDFQALLDIIPNALYTIKFPFVPLHGDVWRANTLIEENILYRLG